MNFDFLTIRTPCSVNFNFEGIVSHLNCLIFASGGFGEIPVIKPGFGPQGLEPPNLARLVAGGIGSVVLPGRLKLTADG